MLIIFLYSVNGISYYDKEINRLYPGIVDLDRFNSSILNKSIDFGEEPHIGAKIILKNIRKEERKTVYYNEDFSQKNLFYFLLRECFRI